MTSLGTRARIALVIALGGALAWLVFRGSSGTETSEPAPTAAQATPAADPAGERPAVADIARPAEGEAVGEGTAATRMGEARDIYQAFSAYPPWSRPATPEYAEVYDFNQRGPANAQAIGNIGMTEVHARIALDRMFVEPGRAATITAECWTEKDGVREAIDYEAVAEVQVAVNNPPAIDEDSEPIDLGFRTSSGHLALSRTDKRADRRIGQLDPATFAALAEAPRSARVMVWFQVDGIDTKPLTLGFAYNSRPPVRVLGVAGEKIVKGSLEITLEVDIAGVTPVRLRGALAQAGHTDHPIATYDKWYRPTAAGRQLVTLQFFGKILREAELDGPYELYRVHGSAYLAGAQVPEVFFQDERSFRTRAYRAEQFAGDEWRDPERDEKLRVYADVIDGLQRHQAGQ